MALPYKTLEEFCKLYKAEIKIPFAVYGIIPNYVKEDKIVLQFLIEYQKRLKKINERTKKYKSKTIFITQNVHKDHFLSNALNIINITTKNFCINNEIICLPLDEKVNFDFEKNFYDGIHTRPSGNKKIAEYISYELKKKIEKK